MNKLTPVIHVQTFEQALKNVEICVNTNVDGLWLINHSISCNKLASIYKEVRNQFPCFWIGINVLDVHPLKAIGKFDNIQGFWVDNPYLNEERKEQPDADYIRVLLKEKHPQCKYFGG